MSLAELAGITPDVDEAERTLIVNGRYRLPDPETGNPKQWTRVTNHIKAIEDEFALQRWEQRMVATGLVARPDLLALAAAHLDDRNELNDVCSQAREAAKASAGANHGTALHAFTEKVDRGEPVPAGPWSADLAAYEAAIAEYGIVVDVDWCERVVVVPEIGAAGRFDKLVRVPGYDLPLIADVKTGQIADDDPAKVVGKWASQLACYAHAPVAWVFGRDEWEPMPTVDQGTGLVIWLPAGTGTCHLFTVDIAAGWEGAKLAGDVRGYRRRTASFAAPLQPGPAPDAEVSPPPPAAEGAGPTSEPAVAADPARVAWVLERIETIKAAGSDAALTLGRLWPDRLAGVATPRAVRDGGTWSTVEIDAVVEVVALVEATHGIPFGPADPTVDRTSPEREPTGPPPLPDAPADDGAPVDEAAVRRTTMALPAEDAAIVQQWARDGLARQRPFTPSPLHERHVAVLNAAIACATHLFDPTLPEPESLVRGAIEDAWGRPVEPTWFVGAALGCLTVDEANRLAELAASVASDTTSTKETSNP